MWKSVTIWGCIGTACIIGCCGGYWTIKNIKLIIVTSKKSAKNGADNRNLRHYMVFILFVHAIIVIAGAVAIATRCCGTCGCIVAICGCTCVSQKIIYTATQPIKTTHASCTTPDRGWTLNSKHGPKYENVPHCATSPRKPFHWPHLHGAKQSAAYI